MRHSLMVLSFALLFSSTVASAQESFAVAQEASAIQSFEKVDYSELLVPQEQDVKIALQIKSPKQIEEFEGDVSARAACVTKGRHWIHDGPCALDDCIHITVYW